MLSVLTTNKKEHRKRLEVVYMIMVSQVCAYVQMHLIVRIKYVCCFGLVWFFWYMNYTSIKLLNINYIRVGRVPNSNLLLKTSYHSRLL